ncbi:MAG: type I methionyl aminopeptidase [Mycobacteriales bacterium]
MIQLKSAAEIAKMRVAGLVVGQTLAKVRDAVAPGVSSADLDALAHDAITGAGATPSFLGYRGFPATLCTSINDEIVHGIPSRKRSLHAGDIISIDCGAIVDGWHGDAAITVAVGAVDPELTRLLAVGEDSMWAMFAGSSLGMRLRDLGALCEGVVAPAGFGIVDGYGGHGIGSEMHQDPHVLNHTAGPRGPKVVEGMVLAIEPMITVGDPATRELDDGWTVVTRDGSFAAHFEHTFTIVEDGPIVLTALDGGRAELAARGAKIGTIPGSEVP